jgi:hypothetical protein
LGLRHTQLLNLKILEIRPHSGPHRQAKAIGIVINKERLLEAIAVLMQLLIYNLVLEKL